MHSFTLWLNATAVHVVDSQQGQLDMFLAYSAVGQAVLDAISHRLANNAIN